MEDNITADVVETTYELRENLRNELGTRNVHTTRVSPTSGPGSVTHSEVSKRKTPPGSRTTVKRSKASEDVIVDTVDMEEEDTDMNVDSVNKKNSDDFPEDKRPPMFRNDRKFNKLTYQNAAKVCFEYTMMIEKRASKNSSKNSLEKCDDKLAVVKIPAGEDDAFENLNVLARQKLRPVNKEIDAMSVTGSRGHEETFLLEYTDSRTQSPQNLSRLATIFPR